MPFRTAQKLLLIAATCASALHRDQLRETEEFLPIFDQLVAATALTGVGAAATKAAMDTANVATALGTLGTFGAAQTATLGAALTAEAAATAAAAVETAGTLDITMKASAPMVDAMASAAQDAAVKTVEAGTSTFKDALMKADYSSALEQAGVDPNELANVVSIAAAAASAPVTQAVGLAAAAEKTVSSTAARENTAPLTPNFLPRTDRDVMIDAGHARGRAMLKAMHKEIASSMPEEDPVAHVPN